MRKEKLNSKQFYCNRLGRSKADEQDIMNFSVRDEKGAGLLDYIQHFAFSDEKKGIMRTYIVRDSRSSELVAYFSLKAGLITYNERDIAAVDALTGEKRNSQTTGKKKTRHVFDTLPGVELADFAVNQAYIEKHPDLKGVGLVIFKWFILPIVKEAAEIIGIKILYLFALPYIELVGRYEQYGFTRLSKRYEEELHKRLKPYYDDYCKFMFCIL